MNLYKMSIEYRQIEKIVLNLSNLFENYTTYILYYEPIKNSNINIW